VADGVLVPVLALHVVETEQFSHAARYGFSPEGLRVGEQSKRERSRQWTAILADPTRQHFANGQSHQPRSRADIEKLTVGRAMDCPHVDRALTFARLERDAATVIARGGLHIV